MDKSTNDKVAEVCAAIESHGRTSIVALAGVPGTGKSHVGAIAAQRAANEPLRARELQFHQSYSYEEFVEGMRLSANGAVTVAPGAFLEWNDAATADPDNNYVLLIEELSRGNVSAILGELLTFIEHRDRSFLLTYSRRPMKIAPNLKLIATYNPVDRSALDLDAALLRRLRILHFPPSILQLKEMLTVQGMAEELQTQVENVFTGCEERHSEIYEQLMPFGHGIFAGINDEIGLKELWHQRIKHFLFRPLVSPHPFAASLQDVYPWR